MVQFGGYFRRRQSSRALWKSLRLPQTKGFSGVFVNLWVSQCEAVERSEDPYSALYLCELEWITLFPWASVSLNINWEVCWVGLSDFTWSLPLGSLLHGYGTVLRPSLDLIVIQALNPVFLWLQTRSELYLLVTRNQGFHLHISAVVFLQQAGLPHTNPRECCIWLYSMISLHFTPLQPTSILYLDFSWILQLWNIGLIIHLFNLIFLKFQIIRTI